MAPVHTSDDPRVQRGEMVAKHYFGFYADRADEIERLLADVAYYVESRGFDPVRLMRTAVDRQHLADHNDRSE